MARPRPRRTVIGHAERWSADSRAARIRCRGVGDVVKNKRGYDDNGHFGYGFASVSDEREELDHYQRTILAVLVVNVDATGVARLTKRTLHEIVNVPLGLAPRVGGLSLAEALKYLQDAGFIAVEKDRQRNVYRVVADLDEEWVAQARLLAAELATDFLADEYLVTS